MNSTELIADLFALPNIEQIGKRDISRVVRVKLRWEGGLDGEWVADAPIAASTYYTERKVAEVTK